MNNQANQPSAALDMFSGERGIPSVSHDRSSTKNRVLVVIVLLGVLTVIGVMLFWKYKRHARAAMDSNTSVLQLTNAVPPRTFVEPPRSEPPPLPEPAVAVPTMLYPDFGATSTSLAPPLPGGAARRLDKSASALMVASRADTHAEQAEGIASQLGVATQLLKNTKDGPGAMTALLGSTQTATRQAGYLGNRNFLLAKGAFIDCALQTRLDSTIPGMTACVVTRNIYSDNGKVLLIERGSTVTGEYQSNMRQGMARIFVLWNRIKTPSGVVVNLDSPGADPLGGAGLPGYIDTHFWQRFGGALMLSLVDDVARGLTTEISRNSSNQINLNSTGEATQDMATEALKSTINIPPTLYKNQGEQIGIYVARDLDFSSIYDVAAR